MNVYLDPEIAAIFNQSTSVSGKFHIISSWFSATLISCFKYSDKRHFEQFNESKCQETKIKSTNWRGQATSGKYESWIGGKIDINERYVRLIECHEG